MMRLPPRKNVETVIGVVGAINEQKGSEIIAQMADLITQRKLRARLVIVGTINGVARHPKITVTGPYQRDKLVEHLVDAAIDVFIIPSIWPETFCYVAEELMALEVPIASFAIGAHAERLASYPLGRLTREISAQALLSEVLALMRISQTVDRSGTKTAAIDSD